MNQDYTSDIPGHVYGCSHISLEKHGGEKWGDGEQLAKPFKKSKAFKF